MNPQDPTQRMREIASELHQAGRIMGNKPRGEEIQADIDQALAELSKLLDDTFKVFFDTFEKEIDQQEFAIDEAEWLSLIQSMRAAEKSALQQPNQKEGRNQ